MLPFMHAIAWTRVLGPRVAAGSFLLTAIIVLHRRARAETCELRLLGALSLATPFAALGATQLAMVVAWGLVHAVANVPFAESARTAARVLVLPDLFTGLLVATVDGALLLALIVLARKPLTERRHDFAYKFVAASIGWIGVIWSVEVILSKLMPGSPWRDEIGRHLDLASLG